MTDIPSRTYIIRPSKAARKRNAKLGWFNWYINRGHIGLEATSADLRRLSWRRAI